MTDTPDLFGEKNKEKTDSYIPLAERCRPVSLDEITGHEKYLNPDAPLRRQIEAGRIPSIILWGPPGVGKTTVARAVSAESDLPFRSLSAVTSGVKELKGIIQQARRTGRSHILFIDEIHRYNKAQQDGLLHAVEDGTIVLIGATTENPSFEIIPPLLSRCQVLHLEPLPDEQLQAIVRNALSKDPQLSRRSIEIDAMEELIHYGSGDARRTLNLLENCVHMFPFSQKKVVITREAVREAARQNTLLYDKHGDYHYDTISAFIKSVRGSDPDAAVHYLARMLDGGEDPVFIARRLIILASEDIGNAEPYALSLAAAGLNAVHALGMPEARIVLAQVTTYLAGCPKSNAAYLAVDEALSDVKKHPKLQIPLHLRNASTRLAKDMGYGRDYKYPHQYPGHFVDESYLPEELQGKVYYRPGETGRERQLKERLEKLWPNRYIKPSQ